MEDLITEIINAATNRHLVRFKYNGKFRTCEIYSFRGNKIDGQDIHVNMYQISPVEKGHIQSFSLKKIISFENLFISFDPRWEILIPEL